MEIEGSTGKTNDLGSATQIRSRKIYSTRPEQEQRHPHRSITKSNIIPARTSPRAWSSPGQSAPKNMVIPDRSAPRVLSSRPERSGVEGSASLPLSPQTHSSVTPSGARNPRICLECPGCPPIARHSRSQSDPRKPIGREETPQAAEQNRQGKEKAQPPSCQASPSLK